MKKSVANGLLVFVTVIWGGGFIATASALETFQPFYVMMIRFVGSALLSFVIAFPRLKKIKTSTVIKGIVAGVFLFLAFSFQTFGLQQTTASKNAFLTATNVVFVPYLCWIIFRKRPGVRQIAASLICVVGISLLTLKGDSVSFGIGDFYSLLCAIFFACHIISWRLGNKRGGCINHQRCTNVDFGHIIDFCCIDIQHAACCYQRTGCTKFSLC